MGNLLKNQEFFLLPVPIFLPGFPSCFSYMRQFSKFVLRVLNSFLCPPGPPLPNPKASIKPKGWTLQCLTQLFLAPLWALHSPSTVLVLKNLTSEEYLQ